MSAVPNRRVLVVSTSFALTTSYPLQILEASGCEVLLARGPHTEARMAELIPGFAAVIVGIDPVTERVVEAGRSLRVVAKHGIGVDNIDVGACTRHDVLVTSVPGANSDAVAEFTVCLLLALARNLLRAVASLADGRWEGPKFVGPELSGKTLGIVGLGAIGQRVAQLAQGLRMTVMYSDVVRHREFEHARGVRHATLAELLREADFVSVHVPLTPTTHNLIDAQALNLMKPTAYVLNLSRGGVVDEEALREALQHHRIAGAAIDVFRQEPPDRHHPFFSLENVLLTPHMAGYTYEANEHTSVAVAEDVARVLTGRPPVHGLNMAAIGLVEDGGGRR